MKKLLTLAALLGAASLSFGQGIVNFGNASVATRISTNQVYQGAATGITGTAGNGYVYYYALLEAPTTQTTVDSSLAGWTFTGNYATNTLTGRFNGNYTSDPGVVVNGAPGSSANFLIVGWSGNVTTGANAPAQGSTAAWNAVLAAWNGGSINASAAPASGFWFGYSAIAANQVIGGGASPVPTPAGAIPTFTLGFQPVPEPTSFALMGLGAAAMMIFRRRK